MLGKDDALVSRVEGNGEEVNEKCDKEGGREGEDVVSADGLAEEEEEEQLEDGEAEEREIEAEEDAGNGDKDDDVKDAAAAQVAKDAAGTDISVNSFEELTLDVTVCNQAYDAWKLFISSAASREAAGEAIYAALFESAPSLQSLFVTPRAVQAMRFMNGLASFVEKLIDPPQLKILVETLGFGHLHLDVTVPRVVIFRDAIMDLFKIELAERFSQQAREGWRKLLNYVGGAIIYVKAYYADRVRCLLRSWKQANHGDEDKEKDERLDNSEDANGKKLEKKAGKKKSLWKTFARSTETHANSDELGSSTGNAEAKDTKGGGSIGSQSVPTTYPEMFLFNAAVMGFGQSAWMGEVLACFENIVTNVANSARLQEECDVLALRIARVVKGNVNLGEYKSCMLASLRSLLPKDWDSMHEVAWTWLWENVERLVLRIHGQPPKWEGALKKFLTALDEDQKFEIRKDIYSTFFTTAPAGQDYFKQSNTYLHFIADKIMNMTLELYENPIKMVDDISALGLRHVGYAIPTELFGPFVSACVEVVMTRTSDETLIESFRWSLALTSKMLVRTITEGSTIVMKAINTNSQRQLKKAISCAPRGERAAWMLIVQVGTQSISPLAWSIEAGNTEAASAIIRDLLTFRADRDKYYYGVDELFKRHRDIIQMLCDQAIDLVPKLLDGLTWRSRTIENGMRRVNYYVKHLVMYTGKNGEVKFARALRWINATQDAKLVCHPVIVFVADLMWDRVAYRLFMWGNAWFLFSLVIFTISQSILEHLDGKGLVKLDNNRETVKRYTVFICRVFIYVCRMVELFYAQARQTVISYRSKDTVKLLHIPIPGYLRQWKEVANLFLALTFVGMLCLEPILWCWSNQEGKLFYQYCDQYKHLRLPYSILASAAMFLNYVKLMNLTVVSTRVSAFALVCMRMASEVFLFLGALGMAVLAYSSAASVLKQENVDFAGIHKGSYTLLSVVMGTYPYERYALLRDEPLLLTMSFVYCILTVVFFWNLFIARLSCEYSTVYADMVGYARLERTRRVLEVMPSLPKRRWQSFMDSLNFNKRLEFNQGDIGVAGGMQIREAANMNPTTVDMIRRFGGSTSPEIPWPEDDADGGEGDDKFDRIEKLIQKTMQRVSKKNTHARRAGGGGGGGTGTGTGSNDMSASVEIEEDAQ